MTDAERAELKRLAEAANAPKSRETHSGSYRDGGWAYDVNEAFADAANPAAVLDLLEHIAVHEAQLLASNERGRMLFDAKSAIAEQLRAEVAALKAQVEELRARACEYEDNRSIE